MEMDYTWFSILSLCALLVSGAVLVFSRRPKLPPGPIHIPIISTLLFSLSTKSFSDVEPIIRSLCSKYGSIVSLHIGHRPTVFIRDRFLAHRTLVQNGAVFADRPLALPTNRIFSSNQRNVSSAPYGPTWRLLRRNLSSEILHPSRLPSFSRARKSVLNILLSRLLADPTGTARVIDHFQYAMFCLLVFMCFGDNIDQDKIQQIEDIQRRLLLRFSSFNVLNFWPRVGKVIFRSRWSELYKLRQSQDDVYVPLIRARKLARSDDEFVPSYVDTLLDLQVSDEKEKEKEKEKRKLTESEIVSLCSEFLNAGTDTTSTALQWIMANMVKYPQIQEKLFTSMKDVMGDSGAEEVREEDLQRMEYLKAVVLEGLRRHPPAHFVLPHSVTEDVTVEGYLVPKTATVNFMVAEMGWDPDVWEEPMSFNPERFTSCANTFDVTGSREIKMMPFGAGRRICPGHGLAMLHLEYFVANLVWNFKWTAVDGDDVDLSEKQEFTIVMKTPLKAHISLRSK